MNIVKAKPGEIEGKRLRSIFVVQIGVGTVPDYPTGPLITMMMKTSEGEMHGLALNLTDTENLVRGLSTAARSVVRRANRKPKGLTSHANDGV